VAPPPNPPLQQTNARDLIVGSEFIAVRSQLNARTLADVRHRGPSTVLSAIGEIFASLGGEVFFEAVGQRIVRLLRPVTRPIWRAFVVARWPWPLLIVLPLGVASMLKAYALLSSPVLADAGLAMFFGSASVSLLTLILWSETRRERRSTRG
jgi:hypothetical protein